mgnify:FL=1
MSPPDLDLSASPAPGAHSLGSLALIEPDPSAPDEGFLAGLLSLLAPVACLSCKAPLPEADPSLKRAPWPGALCARCREELSWIDAACLGCGRGRGPGLESCRRCPSCIGRARGRIAATVALWRYRGPGRALVRRLKYADLPTLGPALGTELAVRVRGVLPGLPRETLVVPIPLHPLRRATRGYNQAREIGIGLSRALDLELAQPLRRARYTRPLYGLPHRRRAGVLQGAFRATTSLEGRPVLLVDDVRTSGATLRSAARTLHQAGAGKIQAAVLAR